MAELKHVARLSFQFFQNYHLIIQFYAIYLVVEMEISHLFDLFTSYKINNTTILNYAIALWPCICTLLVA